SVAGQSGLEDISGTVTVNDDCTGTATVQVEVNRQLQRTAELALVYDSSGNHMRAIFQSLILSNGTNVPVVLTIDANRVTTRNYRRGQGRGPAQAFPRALRPAAQQGSTEDILVHCSLRSEV